jgi:D-galactarolactone cycloisomerase
VGVRDHGGGRAAPGHRAAGRDPFPRRTPPVIELDQAPNSFRQKLSDLEIGPVMSVPRGPGLGIEIDRSVIEAYRA